MVDTTAHLRIGELAAGLDLNPKTIRYYESIGLLPPPRRTAARYRLYGEADRERLRFILKARAIGLTLAEIGEILALRREGEQPCTHVLGLLDHKLAAVEQQLGALSDFRDELATLRREAAEMIADDGRVCSIIEHHETGRHIDLLPVTTLHRSARPRRRC
jgi:DNA-binding transcriptional MerR regulator